MSETAEVLPLLLLKARESSLARVRPVLQDHGLTEPQWRVIHALYQHPNLNAHRLADESCLLGPSLSRILSRFAAERLILRSVSSADQRSVNIRLSAKGRRLYERLRPKLEAHYRAFEEEVPAGQLQQLTELLQEFLAEPG